MANEHERNEQAARQQTLAQQAAMVPPPANPEAHREATERARQQSEELQKRAREKAREHSEKMFEAQQKALTETQEQVKKNRELVEQHRDEAQKERERRAGLDPVERQEEDERRAAMTAEEIGQEDISKGQVGFVTPEQLDQINLLASSYPTYAEVAHPAEMILTEANGQRSRAYAYLAGAVTIKVGQPLKQTVAPTSTSPGTFVAAAAGADCQAIAIYGGTGDATNGLRIAVLVRDCEINGYQISWGAISAPEQAIGLTTLAAAGIIVRY